MHPKTKTISWRLLSIGLVYFIIVGGIIFSKLEGWSYLDSMYFSVMTMTTTGFGDITPVTQVGKLVAMIYAISGLMLVVGFMDLVWDKIHNK